MEWRFFRNHRKNINR